MKNPSHFISLADLGAQDILDLLDSAADLKEKRMRRKVTNLLSNKSLAMIFEKPSTRTRVSFEVSMTDLGGHALYLNWNDLQLDRGESIKDTARVLSSYCHGIMARTHKHEHIQALSECSTVPVINALSNIEHPCQLLADLMTIREFKGRFNGLKFSWVGDGNNVCNSAILACSIMGMDMSIACPAGYGPDKSILKKGENMGFTPEITNDMREAVADADIIYTDTWISMGDEFEAGKRIKALTPYQVNDEIVGLAKDNVIILHCLPAHRGQEITDGVIDGPHSAVFEQAENRLHAQKALLLKLLG